MVHLSCGNRPLARCPNQPCCGGEWRALYGARAGIEGCLSQGVRLCGLRRSRYVGLAKTHLQHVATAAALNVARLDAWLRGRPRAATRTSRFVQLMAA